MFKPVESVAFRFELFGVQFSIYWYGILIALGILVGVWLAMKRAKKLGYNADMVIDLCLIAVPLAVIFARLYYVIFFDWAAYASDPIRILYIWEGGLAIYGAVIGGALGVFIYTKWKKVSMTDFLDIASPSLIFAQAVGRWGNYFNQEAFGNAVDSMAVQNFPFACVYIEKYHEVGGVQCLQPYHLATFFYESAWNFIVFAFLLLYWRKKRPTGTIFALYLIGYGIGRAVIEGLRTDSLMLADIRISQWLSVVFIIAGAFYLYYAYKKKIRFSGAAEYDQANGTESIQDGQSMEDVKENGIDDLKEELPKDEDTVKAEEQNTTEEE
ncbi:MAG: prolipoprotein diacylglyceryl transferase [Christensenellales bacterium]